MAKSLSDLDREFRQNLAAAAKAPRRARRGALLAAALVVASAVALAAAAALNGGLAGSSPDTPALPAPPASSAPEDPAPPSDPSQGQETETHQGQGTETPTGQGTETPQGQGTEPPQGQGTETPQGQGTETPTGQEEYLVTVSGAVSWRHGDMPPEGWPDQAVVLVLQGGETMAELTVSETENWRFSVDLPRYGQDGAALAYTLQGSEIPGYRAVTRGTEIEYVYENGGAGPETAGPAAFGLWLALTMGSALALKAVIERRRRW